ISTAYLSDIDLSSLGFSQGDGRDPTFEIYSPPYVFRNDRPVIQNVPAKAVDVTRGQLYTITTPDAAKIDSAVMLRRTATTPLVEGAQRAVVLPIVARASNWVRVKTPAAAAVAPGGHYMLFVRKTSADGPIPSASTPIRVVGGGGTCG